MSFSPLSFKYILVSLLCIGILACGTALYIPTEENTPDPEVLTAKMEGRKLYIAKCSSCHNLYTPQSHTSAQWNHQMQEMKVQAKIDDNQASAILLYLTSYPETKR